MILLNSVLVATDFGETSRAALDYGRNLARAFGGRLHLLHVVDARVHVIWRPSSSSMQTKDSRHC